MSDTLEVKIGASDAGLEATLKTVQAELANMEAKVKSGDLSFNELEKTMRRMGQVEGLEKKLKEMGDEAAGAAPKVDNLSKELEGVGAKASGLGGFFDESFAKMAGAVSVGNIAAAGFNKAVDLAFTGAQAVVQGFGDALDLGGRLSELSARTGESAGKLLVLETAFKNAGLGAETVGTSINKLQNFMQDAANGGDKQVDTMKRLGISMAELQGKTPTEQMQIFADKIAAIDDPTQRAATASDVFGDKLGGKLLPLLTDFSPALDDAREKVGSMEQVMDENAATFDTAGETIDTVKGKMTTFAAGVLSEVIPAVRGLGEEMSKVDFASFGEKVGEVLVGKIEKFKDATTGASELVKFLNNALGSAVNSAIPVDDAFTKITDTTVDLYEGFEKARTYTSVLGIAWDLLTSKGAEIRASQDSAAEGIANTGDAAGEASGKIGEVGNKTDEATGKIGELGTQAESTGESIASSFSLNGEFAPQLDSVAASWGNINEQVTGNQELLSSNLSLGESMVGKTEEQTQSLGFLNEQHSLQEQLAKTIDYTYGEHAKKLEDNAAKQDKIAEKEAMRKAQAQETLQFELQLAEAKATGNKQEIEDLTKKKEWLDAWKKAIASGMGEEQAAAFANNLAAAKINADNIKPPAFTTAKEDAQAMENALGGSKSFLEAMGKIEKSKAVEEAKLDAKAARAEIEAFGKYMNVDLQNMAFADIAEKLGVRDLSLTGQEQIKAIMNFVGESKDKLAVNPIDSEKAKQTWQEIRDSITGEKTIIPLDGDTSSAQQKIEELVNPKTLDVSAETTAAKKQIEDLSGKTSVDLDASESVKKTREQLKEGLELDISAKSSASGLLETIKGFVEEIKTLVEKIEPRLPVAALTA